MTRFTGVPISILGTGLSVPEKHLTNADLEKMVDTTNEWILERTGISERRIAEGEETTSSLSYSASLQALSNSEMAATDLDMIVVGTLTPDTLFPSVAARVQGMLGATNAGAMDIEAGCPSAVYAMTVAAAGIQAGLWKNVLVIGADVISPLIDWSDRNTCVLFGDGAGACILSSSRPGKIRITAADLKADGTKSDYIELLAGGSARPVSAETVANGEHFVKMKGSEVFKFVNKEIPPYLKGFCEQCGLAPEDIDWWILHQANERMIESIMRRLSLPTEKAVMNLGCYGNTCAATVMLLLHEMVAEGRIQPGQKAVLSSFGAGMTWGAVLLEA